MIVGTAGHIDHGKTTLVRALTGVDTDRLPEEKQRGISIELGYAFLDVPTDGATPAPRIGFIDVPGHERLVHTMVAGASGIDFALLLVAADDGPMPQTHEHLAVLSLLGLTHGAVVVTKCDRVDTTRAQAVCDEAATLVAGTPLAGCPVLAVSAQSGQGLDELRSLLFSAARRMGQRADRGAFRLAVDRGFTLGGTGTVVTGTVHAGTVAVGDELVLLPTARTAGSHAMSPPIRVRSLHAQNQTVTQAHAGQRCAVALAGVPRDAVSRGQWLVSPDVALTTDRLDATLTLWQGEARALRSGTPVQVHIGAASTMGTVAVLQADVDGAAVGDLLSPGHTARVQLVLRELVGAWYGDRIILRDASASRTLAGGTVLDPFAPVRYRRTPQRLVELAALSLPDAIERLSTVLQASATGIDLSRWAKAQGTGLNQVLAAFQGADVASDTVNRTGLHGALVSPPGPDGAFALSAQAAQTVADAVHAALTRFHEQQPDELGPDATRLRRLAAPRLPQPLWAALLAQWVKAGTLAQRGAFIHLPEHGAQLSATEGRIAQKVAPHLTDAGFEGAWARDLAKASNESEPLVRATLARLARRGELHQVVKDLYYPNTTMNRLAALARDVAAAHSGEVNAAPYRDATQLGRKRAIQILEYFDRVGLLRRVGDVHKLRAECSLFGS